MIPEGSPAPSIPEHGAKQEKRKPWGWVLAGGLGGFVIGVLLTLGLAAASVVPKTVQRFQFTQRKKAEADLMSIASALREFSIANGGKYPDSLEWLVTPDANDHTFLDCNQVPKDSWGREFVYSQPSPGHPLPDVVSYGRDGRPGGEGEDADIDLGSLRHPR